MSRTFTNLAPVLLLLCLSIHARAADALDPASAKPNGELLYYDIRALGIEGQGWTQTEAPFDRFPSKAKGVVRQPVWNLSRDSAGMSVRFVTAAQTISARWTVTSPSLAMPHMPATGVSGLDLYVKNVDGHLRFLGNGRPVAVTTTAKLADNLPPGQREYTLYLPLYNGVSSVEIGVPKDVPLLKAPARPADRQKPIVFYGTSITQGGCASRPGMCHTAILGRRLDRPTINLGFSGNGKMEPEIAALLAEIDAAAYVIEAVPNMDAKLVSERAEPLVQTIRKAHPNTPIVLVEDPTWPSTFLVETRRHGNQANRAALHKAYDDLIGAGDKNLAYLSGDKLLSPDGEDTVDGTHPTDLGFTHHADAMTPMLEGLLGK